MENVKTIKELGHIDSCSAALAIVREFHTDPKSKTVSVILCDDDFYVIKVTNTTNPDYGKWRKDVIGLAVAQGLPVHLVVVYDVDKDNPTPIGEETEDWAGIAPIRDLRVALCNVRGVGLMDAIAVGRGGIAYTYAGERLFTLKS